MFRLKYFIFCGILFAFTGKDVRMFILVRNVVNSSKKAEKL